MIQDLAAFATLFRVFIKNNVEVIKSLCSAPETTESVSIFGRVLLVIVFPKYQPKTYGHFAWSCLIAPTLISPCIIFFLLMLGSFILYGFWEPRGRGFSDGILGVLCCCGLSISEGIPLSTKISQLHCQHYILYPKKSYILAPFTFQPISAWHFNQYVLGSLILACACYTSSYLMEVVNEQAW